MADKSVKGVIIKLGADFQSLKKSFKEVNSQSIRLQDELKTVQKLLKLDSGNVTLAAQKQEILTKAIETSKKKLEDLKKAQDAVNELFQSGKIDAEQYRAYQREIADTEIGLHTLEGRLQSANQALDGSGTGFYSFW